MAGTRQELKEQASLSLDPVVKSWLRQAGAAMTLVTGEEISGSNIANDILRDAMIQAGGVEDMEKLRKFLQKKVLKLK